MADAAAVEGKTVTRDEQGRFAATGTPPDEAQAPSTGEQAAAQPAPEPSEEARKAAAFQKAAEDERHKRQESERVARQAAEEAAYWRGQAEARVAAQGQPQESGEDPDVAFIASPSKKSREVAQEAAQRAAWEAKVEVLREIERDKHEDFDEKEAVWSQQRRLNPTIANHPDFQKNPPRFVYKWATEFLKPKDAAAAPDALTAKIAELEKTVAELRSGNPPAPIPQTQAGARNVSGPTAPESKEDWLAEATVKRGGKRPF